MEAIDCLMFTYVQRYCIQINVKIQTKAQLLFIYRKRKICHKIAAQQGFKLQISVP